MKHVTGVVIGIGIVCVVALALLRATGATETIYACVDARGHLRVVAEGVACLSAENPLQWNVAGPEGPVGPQGPTGDPGLQGEVGPQGPSGPSLKVVDSNGEFVGFLTGAPVSYTSLIGRQVDGNWLLFYVDGNDFRSDVTAGPGVTFYHESSDCSGPAYSPADSGLASIERGHVGTVKYFSSPSDAIERRLLSRSHWNGIQPQCTQVDETRVFGGVIAVDVSAFGLVPPFRLSE